MDNSGQPQRPLATSFNQRNPQDQMMSMAGLLIASGMPFNKALPQASHMIQQQNSGGGHSPQKMQAIQMLGQAQSPEQRNQILYSGYFTPAEIETFSKLGGGGKEIISGSNGLKYTQSKDPSTGGIRLDLIPGQVEKPAITPAEARINNNQVTKLANSANSAQMENRYLDDAEEYFKQYDKAEGTDSLVSSGSFLARNAPAWAQNAILNKEGQSAKQKIDKVTGLIFQNRVIGAGSNATDAFKEMVKKSLPTTEITPEAREELILTKRRENMATLTRSKFISEWYKQNSKDIAGAEDAYDSYIGSVDLLTKDGLVNKQLLKDIPKVVTEYIGTSSQPLKDNRVPAGSAPMSDNTDAMYANPNGTLAEQLGQQVPQQAPQQMAPQAAAPTQNDAQQLQAWAAEAIAAGRDPAAVNAKLTQMLGGK